MTRPEIITGLDPSTGEGIAAHVANGKIAAIVAERAPDQVYLSAGLIDLQINGYGGLDLNSGSVAPDQVIALTEAIASLGVTAFLPTLITASEASLCAALSAIAAARRGHPIAARMIAGVHIEGPSISPIDGPRGAHPLAHVRAPSLTEFQRWQTASDHLVRLVTLAPEQPGSEAYIRALTAGGVHVAIGHTAASPEQIRRAVDAGARLSTHLGNGASAMLPRHPNFIWSQLADDRLTATFIADGHHLPADAFKTMLRAKGLERAILVSDSVSLAGMPPGRYDQAIGGAVVLDANGRIGVADTPYLAGAGLPLSATVAIAAAMADLTLADALRLATINPGRFVDGRGRLAVGEPADLIRFNWKPGATSLAIEETWMSGRRIARR